MNPQISYKIKIVSFISMIMVVILHSYNLDTKFKGVLPEIIIDYNWFIQNFISNGMARIAVPVFFIISGYLIFKEGYLSKNLYIVKIKNRIKTLFIPFLFWSLLSIVIYFILQEIPQLQPFFSKELIKSLSFSEFLKLIFFKPIPYQLWFLRELFLLVLLSPIFYFLLRKLKWIILVVISVPWFIDLFEINQLFEALFFFNLGIYLSLYFNNLNIKLSTVNKPQLFFLLWIVLVFLKTYLGFQNFNDNLILFFHKTSILIGVYTLFILPYEAIEINENLLKKAFIIYLIHEPILTFFKKGMLFVIGNTSIDYLIVYLVSPIAVILLSLLLGSIFKKISNELYSLSVGGRE
jgi:surface polysaccharide O-acyltransferase-like enzyme